MGLADRRISGLARQYCDSSHSSGVDYRPASIVHIRRDKLLPTEAADWASRKDGRLCTLSAASPSN